MRIDIIHIRSRFKNLEDFKIDIDENSMETVLIGLNATGKSNLMEALVVIFRDLDLDRPPQISKSKDPFEYYIKYQCRGNDIEIDYSTKDGYTFITNGIKLSKTGFYKNKDSFLPKHVFIYYSGISERLKDLYYDHTKKYYEQIIRKEAKHTRFDSIPRIFLVQNIHSSFALIAFYMFKDQEKETIQFLKEELKIEDFGSALFILKQPEWSKSRKEHDRFWNAGGLVRRFLEDLYRFSTAPIYHEERVATTYKKSETQSRLYLYIKDRKTFQDLVDTKMYSDKIPLFNALNSIEISDLLYDVKIKVAKENVNGELGMSELSEGEKQLLTVLGMLKFTKDEESLILLDEPDTHLNPMWKWKFLEYLDKVVKRPETTQIIFCTHDPLVIGNLKKNQVQIFQKDPKGKTTAYNPNVSPREMSFSKILTSELFGIPSLMSKKLEDLLNEKRFLQAKITKGPLDEEERKIFERLKRYFDRIGFNDDTVDSRYNRFLQLTSEKQEFVNRKYTKEEEKQLDEIAREVLEQIIKEEKEGGVE
ncbi:ATP-binding protein [Chitinophaga sancti]|uniref:AAA domain-containing protein, putative AbiEii toxin, Type IV TA system n=1 Tax=Chitinophaga sancti TaxID=1004 RepID=A0A1K1S8G6_9BACT|nr:ATP-binding protein [Chitinophaga sancti]WQD62137.1 AAA family ATPase [Chitinophaga sancti]WQG92294.1 AAA family ATPase [Chitinophaga sancti]SFW80301.1 AAA domain-containing protein, putative AbiEii toxin, Type IV TA system [Chitinophaga sancti]